MENQNPQRENQANEAYLQSPYEITYNRKKAITIHGFPEGSKKKSSSRFLYYFITINFAVNIILLIGGTVMTIFISSMKKDMTKKKIKNFPNDENIINNLKQNLNKNEKFMNLLDTKINWVNESFNNQIEGFDIKLSSFNKEVNNQLNYVYE